MASPILSHFFSLYLTVVTLEHNVVGDEKKITHWQMIVIIIFDGRLKEALDVKLSKSESQGRATLTDRTGTPTALPHLSLPPTPPSLSI
jgi:hypothetical protein